MLVNERSILSEQPRPEIGGRDLASGTWCSQPYEMLAFDLALQTREALCGFLGLGRQATSRACGVAGTEPPVSTELL